MDSYTVSRFGNQKPITLMLIEIFYYMIFLPAVLWSLRITRLEVPALVSTGHSATLSCLFDLDTALYSVKWYRDDREFFRYFPSLTPHYMAFPAPGIDIDVSLSTWNRVHLRNVSVQTEGRYTCQVSADEPHFGCVQEHRHLGVYVAPDSLPRISGEMSDLGENLTVRCWSAKSRPAANLSWYVNDVMMNSDEVMEVVRHADHLESTSSSLHLPMTSPHLQSDVIRVTCSASIADVISSSSEELLISRPKEKVLELKNAAELKRTAQIILTLCLTFLNAFL